MMGFLHSFLPAILSSLKRMAVIYGSNVFFILMHYKQTNMSTKCRET